MHLAYVFICIPKRMQLVVYASKITCRYVSLLCIAVKY